jgi:hypothetical protein
MRAASATIMTRLFIAHVRDDGLAEGRDDRRRAEAGALRAVDMLGALSGVEDIRSCRCRPRRPRCMSAVPRARSILWPQF